MIVSVSQSGSLFCLGLEEYSAGRFGNGQGLPTCDTWLLELQQLHHKHAGETSCDPHWHTPPGPPGRACLWEKFQAWRACICRTYARTCCATRTARRPMAAATGLAQALVRPQTRALRRWRFAMRRPMSTSAYSPRAPRVRPRQATLRLCGNITLACFAAFP